MMGRDRQLRQSVAGDLRVFASAVRTMVLRALEDEEVAFRAATMALWPDQTGEGLAPDIVSFGSLDDREAALTAPTAHARFRLAWTPEQMSVPALDLADFSTVPGYTEAEARLMGALEHEVDEPGVWALSHALAELSQDPPLPYEPHQFVAYAFDDQFSDDLVDSIRASCPEDLALRLKSQGLLPDRVRGLLDA